MEGAIVRILATSTPDYAVGIGVFVGERHVLTCAHVVAQAIIYSELEETSPKSPVLLEFPFVAPGQVVTATVVCWEPAKPDFSGSGPEDIAVLRLSKSIPQGAKSVCLVDSIDTSGHNFKVFGCPETHNRKGAWASGKLGNLLINGWIQVEGIRIQGFQIESGYSGSPVWDQELEAVIGITVAADIHQPERKVGYVIPTRMLMEAWPILAGWVSSSGKSLLKEKAVVLSSPFQCVGALSKDSKVYIPRDCDNKLSDKLDKKRFIAIQGDHGIGKTSLLRQVNKMRLCSEDGWMLCDIDLQGMNTEDQKIFLRDLFNEISRSLNEKVTNWGEIYRILTAKSIVFCIDEFGTLNRDSAYLLIRHLHWLAEKPDANIRIIVCLDSKIDTFIRQEVGATNPKYWRHWETVLIQPFTHSEIDKLISFLPQDAWEVAYESKELIYSKSSRGQPNQIQYLCENLFKKSVNNKASKSDFIEIISSSDSYSLNFGL
ncbi:trypsin-like peptidase domain-containing protein [Adonisia turfae]|nr:trypsin-like peptidase domain-containing protein [Adonisia turfae]